MTIVNTKKPVYKVGITHIKPGEAFADEFGNVYLKLNGQRYANMLNGEVYSISGGSGETLVTPKPNATLFVEGDPTKCS